MNGSIQHWKETTGIMVNDERKSHLAANSNKALTTLNHITNSNCNLRKIKGNIECVYIIIDFIELFDPKKRMK